MCGTRGDGLSVDAQPCSGKTGTEHTCGGPRRRPGGSELRPEDKGQSLAEQGWGWAQQRACVHAVGWRFGDKYERSARPSKTRERPAPPQAMGGPGRLSSRTRPLDSTDLVRTNRIGAGHRPLRLHVLIYPKVGDPQSQAPTRVSPAGVTGRATLDAELPEACLTPPASPHQSSWD